MAELSITLKGDGSFSAPWLVFRGDTIKECHEMLAEAHEQDLFTAVGRADAAYETGIRMGGQLDATTTKVEKAPAKKAPAKKPPAKKAAEAPAEAPAEEPKAAPAPAKARPKPAWLS